MTDSRSSENHPGESHPQGAEHPPDPPAAAREPHNLAATGPGFKPVARPYRRPLPPAPIEPYEIRHPAVPEMLDGLTILHITDLHARRKRPIGQGLRRAAEALRAAPADLVLLTGDYMDRPGDEAAGAAALEFLAGSWRARYGAYGTFGNHDSWVFRQDAGGIGGIHWLGPGGGGVTPIPGAPLTLLGFDEPEDVLAGQISKAPKGQSAKVEVPGVALFGNSANLRIGDFSIALAHYPSEIYSLADMGVPLVVAGHTHGGQWRLSPSLAPHTSSDLPVNLASGLLRRRDSLCAISRGLGYAAVEFRVNCPAHIPLYTLRRGALGPVGEGEAERLRCVVPW